MLAALLPSPATAQVAATVEGVQTPAWVERDGKRTALVPGMELGVSQVVCLIGGRVEIEPGKGTAR